MSKEDRSPKDESFVKFFEATADPCTPEQVWAVKAIIAEDEDFLFTSELSEWVSKNKAMIKETLAPNA